MAKNNEYVKKRKSYYGFAKEYPGTLGSSKYVIGESRIVRRNETIRKIVIAIIVILLFIASYVLTTVGFNISNKQPENNKATSVSVDADVVFIYYYIVIKNKSLPFGRLFALISLHHNRSNRNHSHNHQIRCRVQAFHRMQGIQ